jgi:hypothetical protein
VTIGEEQEVADLCREIMPEGECEEAIALPAASDNLFARAQSGGVDGGFAAGSLEASSEEAGAAPEIVG